MSRLFNSVVILAGHKPNELFLKFFIILLLLFLPAEDYIYAQLGFSGYPTFTREQGKIRYGGGLGMGFRNNGKEYWMNLEIYGFKHGDTVFFDPYGYSLPVIEKRQTMYVDLMFLYHKEIFSSFATQTGIYPFWEFGSGLSIYNSEQNSGSGFSTGSSYKARVMLAVQPGAGMDFKRKFRLRCNPYYKLGTNSVSGIQISMFLLFGLESDRVKEEIVR